MCRQVNLGKESEEANLDLEQQEFGEIDLQKVSAEINLGPELMNLEKPIYRKNLKKSI